MKKYGMCVWYHTVFIFHYLFLTVVFALGDGIVHVYVGVLS